jgi:hypothetical protein
MHSSSTRRRRTRQLAGVAAVAALAVVLAGCASTTKNGSSGGGGTPINGVTDKTVKIGITIADSGSLGSSLGFKQVDTGGVAGMTKAINAVIADINKNGGAGGRQITPVINAYLSATDSPQQSQAQCSKYTQDEQVFAVILDAGLQNNAIPCYAKANTLVLDETLIAHDQTQFEKFTPYLWSPTHPEYSAFMKAQLTAMNNAKFFDGNTGVLLTPSDDEVSRRTTESIVKPYLSSIGVTKVQTSYIDSTNTGTLGATSSAALTAGKNAKLNRVVVVGGARIEPVILSDQNANNYDSKWGISTYDNPLFLENNPDSIVSTLRNGMVGLGYAPALDVVSNSTGPAFPDPTNPAQQKCVEVVSAAGATPPQNLRANWKAALQYCDGLYMLDAVLDKLPGKGEVTGGDFKEAAGQIGGVYRSSLTFGASWGPGVYAGTNTGQELRWDEASSSFQYSGTDSVFGATAPAGGAAPATSAPAGGTTPTTAPPAGTTPTTPAAGDPLETITAYANP